MQQSGHFGQCGLLQALLDVFRYLAFVEHTLQHFSQVLQKGKTN